MVWCGVLGAVLGGVLGWFAFIGEWKRGLKGKLVLMIGLQRLWTRDVDRFAGCVWLFWGRKGASMVLCEEVYSQLGGLGGGFMLRLEEAVF